jgi:hypothetical protein
MSNDEVRELHKELQAEANRNLGRGFLIVFAVIVSLAVSIALGPVGIVLAALGWLGWSIRAMRKGRNKEEA